MIRPPTRPRLCLRSLRVLVAIGLGSIGARAHAEDVRVTSSTYARGDVSTTADKAVPQFPFYEYLNISSKDPGIRGLSIEASMWGRIEAGKLLIPDDQRATGDVNVLLLRYRAPQKTLFDGGELYVGRQFVTAGRTIYEQLDGASASYRLPKGFSLSAFGGAVSGVRFARQIWAVNNDDLKYSGNWTAGGRLGYTYGSLLSLGASYRSKSYNGKQAFNELGWDFLATPWSWLEFVTDGSFELIAQSLRETRALVRIPIGRDLSFSSGYHYARPDLFLPRTSIFAVFAQNEYQEVLTELYWRARRWLEFTAEAAPQIYNGAVLQGALSGASTEASHAELRVLLRGDARFGFAGRHHASLEFERQGAPQGGYYRLWLAMRTRLTERLSTVADLDGFVLDDRSSTNYLPATGRNRLGFAGSAYLQVRLRDQLQLLAGGQYRVSQLVQNAGAFLVRLNWQFDSSQTFAGGVNVQRSPSTLAMGL